MLEDVLTDYLNENYLDKINKFNSSKRSNLLEVDYEDLNQYLLKVNGKSFSEGIEDNLELLEKQANIHTNRNNHINVRVKNIPHNYLLRELDADIVGEFISTTAMVKTITNIDPKLNLGVYFCDNCQKLYEVDLNDPDNNGLPKKCSCGCTKFNLQENQSKFDNSRYVQLEEPLELRQSSVARRFKAYMEGFIAGSQYLIKPGDVVDVSGHFGIQKVSNKKGEFKSEFLITIHYIKPQNSSFDETELSDEELNEIMDLKKNPNIFPMLVNTIAPKIYGHNSIKEGLILQQFEGNRPVEDVLRGVNDDRWTIHILLIGDPGIGKSEIMKYVYQNTAKAIRVSGTGSSEAGLTAAVIKDELIEGYTLEGGAVVLADGGIVLIDEFDKLDGTHQKSLNESMESMTQTINKAGINQTLSARTSFLCAANPKNSKFDKYTEVLKQIDMPSSTLSRFDLVYVLEDNIDPDNDRKMAMSILNNTNSFEEVEDIIDIELFMKYISYAKKNIHPTLSEEAKSYIVDFYVNTRKAAMENADAKPITMRDMKAIERLSIARAKCELRDFVTGDDARSAIRIYSEALETLGLNPETIGELRGEKSVNEINLINIFEDAIIEVGKEYGSFDFGKEYKEDILASVIGEHPDLKGSDFDEAYNSAFINIMKSGED